MQPPQYSAWIGEGEGMSTAETIKQAEADLKEI
jgi:hypothetical protein